MPPREIEASKGVEESEIRNVERKSPESHDQCHQSILRRRQVSCQDRQHQQTDATSQQVSRQVDPAISHQAYTGLGLHARLPQVSNTSTARLAAPSLTPPASRRKNSAASR